MPVWMRGRFANFQRIGRRVVSLSTARVSAHTTAASPASSEMQRTDSKSPGLEMGESRPR